MPLHASSLLPLLAAALVCLFPSVRAHDNGMDMSMDGAMDLAEGQMLPYLHFTRGDIVLFLGWVPSSKSAMVGTCIGVFLLALVERWIAACRGVMEAHWRKRAQIAQADRLNLPTADEKRPNYHTGRLRDSLTLRNAPPFILSHDLSRGILHAVQAALQFAFMLIVMTFQVSFILSIVIGLGVGETLFGRFASHAAGHV
ncbi:CTR copper uptake transporter [Trametes sanguinea]|nr:CTR copper uptake transporter [Trametes sanguinea]